MSSPTCPQDELQNAVVSEDPPKQLEEQEPQEEPQQSEQEPYQELKWNDVPLFLNERFDDPADLLANDKQTLPLHAGRTALLVVDVQPEYWSQCPAVRAEFPDFPSKMARLVEQARAQKCKIIWVRAEYRYAHSPWLVQFARLHQGRIPNEVYTPHDAVVEWEDFATPQGGEYVIPKTSWSSTRHTALMDLLKQSGIDTVLVCGLITSVCVQHSAFGIFEAGYRTLLVTDACADRGRARHDAALALYGDYMYELVQTEDLCDPKSDFYLHPAQPVWLTPHSVDTLVQPQFFNTLQDSVVGFATHTAASSSIGDYYNGDVDEEQQQQPVGKLSSAVVPNEEEQTAMTSNMTATHYYKVDHDHNQHNHNGNSIATSVVNCKKGESMGNATTRTSTSSLSTLSSPPITQQQQQNNGVGVKAA